MTRMTGPRVMAWAARGKQNLSIKETSMTSPNMMTCLALATSLLLGVAACKKQEEPTGPAQKAGEAIDKAGEQVSRDMKEGLKNADQAAAELRKAARSAGEKMDDATRDAERGLDKTAEKVGDKLEETGKQIKDDAKK
jgi:hypothetical protein